MQITHHGTKYYQNHLCFYQNRLYRAVEDFEAELDFVEDHWVVLASLRSEDIKYNNLISGLEAENVKEALDELTDLDSQKVKKTRYENKVYGTNQEGDQYLYNKDDLRTVDTVNGVGPTDQEHKNIQIDASDINYDDEAQEPETIKQVLDQKVDKLFAGAGAKIVKDLQIQYVPETGHITITEVKISPEDSSTAEESTEIDIVSETELTNAISDINSRIDEEVADLEDAISDEADRLDGRIDNLTDTVANNKTDIESKLTNAVDGLNNTITANVLTLNSRITQEVGLLNDRITEEVRLLNDRIASEVTALDTAKIDKNINDTIVTGVEVASHDNQPTIKITNKNTTSKNATYDYVHFGTNGLIKVDMEDEDHLVIDSTAIDDINTQQNARLTNAEGRLNAHDTQIATLLEHDVEHDRAIASNSAQILNHETRLRTAETNITTLQNDLLTEVGAREAADNSLSGRITTNATNITLKADKEFADAVDDKVLAKIESDTIVNNELLKLKETFVSPVDGSLSTANIRVISSDNTIVATRGNDGTIDLVANLDTDVNYFVTTETISTTIASETTLDMSHLTPTDKQVVEVQDIITDPEGTWGRVKSINTQANTCVVVTFKKHAQAVWGTIKGTLADQQDLQGVLTGLDTNKVNKTNNANKVYGTDSNGDQITYDKDSFGKVDTVNNVQADANKNVTLTSDDIQLLTDEEKQEDNYPDASIKEIFDLIAGVMNSNIYAMQARIREYRQDNYYEAHLSPTGVDIYNKSTYTYGSMDAYVTFTRDDGIILMARVEQDFTSDNTQATAYESFQYDVEAGNLKLVGIPEEVGTAQPAEDWQYYTEIVMTNTISTDGQAAIVDIYRDVNDTTNSKTGFNIINNSSVENLVVSGVIGDTISPNSTSGVLGITGTNYDEFSTEQDILNYLSLSFVQPPQEDWQLYTTITMNSIVSSDSTYPVVEVYQDINDTTGRKTGIDITNNSNVDDLHITGELDRVLSPNSTTGITPIYNANYDYFQNEQDVLDFYSFTFVSEATPEEVFNVLDEVMGTTGDTYEGLGGTEEEIGLILDNVLGANWIVDNIYVSSEPRKYYIVGDELDLSSMNITATYHNTNDDNYTTSVLDPEEYIVDTSNVDMSIVGDYTITITYEFSSTQYATTFSITVYDTNRPVKIYSNIDEEVFENSYMLDDTFSTNGLTVMALYADNTAQDVTAYSTFTPANGDTLDVAGRVGVFANVDVDGYEFTNVELASVEVIDPDAPVWELAGSGTFLEDSEYPENNIMYGVYRNTGGGEVTTRVALNGLGIQR